MHLHCSYKRRLRTYTFVFGKCVIETSQSKFDLYNQSISRGNDNFFPEAAAAQQNIHSQGNFVEGSESEMFLWDDLLPSEWKKIISVKFPQTSICVQKR